MSRLSKQDRAHMETAFHGPVSRRVLAALDAAEASERDLKARLTRIRAAEPACAYDDEECTDVELIIKRATDLRVRKWRKP